MRRLIPKREKWSQNRDLSHSGLFHFAVSIHEEDGGLSRKPLPEAETYVDGVARGAGDAGARPGIDALGGGPGGLGNRQGRVSLQAVAADSRLA